MQRMIRLAIAALALAALAACQRAADDPGVRALGSPRHGAALISQAGCGACHIIPGVSGGNGQVGPPLNHVGAQTVLAGTLPNTPANMMRWIRAPQSVLPGNAMPDTQMTDQDARDIAAYLYTRR